MSPLTNRLVTWQNEPSLLSALCAYRHALLPPELSSPSALTPVTTVSADEKATTAASAGYGWSRWWRRGGTTADAAPELPPEALAERPTPSEQPASDAISGNGAAEKRFVKTLRLSSDQLVCDPSKIALTTETTSPETRPQYRRILRDLILFR